MSGRLRHFARTAAHEQAGVLADPQAPAAGVEPGPHRLGHPGLVVVVGVLHVIPDEDRPYESIATLLDAVPSGSYLALSHMTLDVQVEGADMGEVTARLGEHMRGTNPPAFRTRAEVARFFDGLDVLDPGVVPLAEWRPDAGSPSRTETRVTPMFCGVARKP